MPLALSAFLASAASTRDLQNEILASALVSEDAHVADYEADWSSLHSTPLPQFPASAKQSVWDAPATAADKTVVLSSFSDRYDQAMLAAVSASQQRLAPSTPGVRLWRTSGQ